LQWTRPNQAAISSFLLLIFSFRGVGAVRKGKRGAELSRFCAPLLIFVSGVPPDVPPMSQGTLGPGREVLLLPGLSSASRLVEAAHLRTASPRRPRCRGRNAFSADGARVCAALSAAANQTVPKGEGAGGCCKIF